MRKTSNPGTPPPACLIVTEAGGKITTFDGGDYDLYSPNILASNGVLHQELSALIQEGCCIGNFGAYRRSAVRLLGFCKWHLTKIGPGARFFAKST